MAQTTTKTSDTKRTQVSKKGWYWAAGAAVAIIAILIGLWLVGTFDASTVVP